MPRLVAITGALTPNQRFSLTASVPLGYQTDGSISKVAVIALPKDQISEACGKHYTLGLLLMKIIQVTFVASTVWNVLVFTAAASPVVTTDLVYQRCGEAEGFPNAIADCIITEETKQGEALAYLYKRLIEQSKHNADLLRSSQRAWLAYQKSNCRLHEEYGRFESPGNPLPFGFSRISFARCLLRTTLERIDDLKRLVATE